MGDRRQSPQRPRAVGGSLKPAGPSNLALPLDPEENFPSSSSYQLNTTSSSNPGRQSIEDRNMMSMLQHSQSYPSRYCSSNPLSNPHLFSPRDTIPLSSPWIPPSSSPFYSPTSIASSSTSPQRFGLYPHSYPSNPYHTAQSNPQPVAPPSLSWRTEDEATSTFAMDSDMFFDPDTLVTDTEPDAMTAATSPLKKSARPAHTPRPPNAWIIYRSEKLKAIASGEQLPGLDTVMAEAGISTSGTEASEESSAEDKLKGDQPGPSEMPPPSSMKKKKAKKGAKEPSRGLLSLGRGKTGRGLPQADISKMISLLWKRESPEVRAEYERLSETRKLQVSEYLLFIAKMC